MKNFRIYLIKYPAHDYCYYLRILTSKDATKAIQWSISDFKTYKIHSKNNSLLQFGKFH